MTILAILGLGLTPGCGAAMAGAEANAYFDYRTISSADALRVGELVYLFFEGVRGPGSGDPGDSQFGLGLVRSASCRVDGPWERYPGNPILVDRPGNVGLGHADVVVHRGHTYLYTSLDGKMRSRMALVWRQNGKDAALSASPKTASDAAKIDSNGP
ncbi:MAG: hypothetical protein ACP5JG_10375 [Anaerolineae bacterium]